MFFVMIVSVYTVRVVLRTLGVEDYGVYGAIGGLISSLSFITSVLANSSQRFFAVGLGANDKKKLNQTFSTMFWIYAIVGIFIILLFETVGNWFLHNRMTIPDGRMEAAEWVFQCMILSFVVSIITAPHQALIIAHEKMTIYAYVGILDVLLKLAVVFLLMVVSVDKLQLYSVLLFLSSLTTSLIYVFYSLLKFKESHITRELNKDIFREVFSFSSWTLFGSLSYICNSQGVNLMLNVFFGPVVNAAYSIGNQIKSFINQFSSNFYAAVRPPLMKSYSANDTSFVKELFFFSSKVVFVLLFIVMFPVAMNIEFILNLWLGEVGDYMVDFIRLMFVYAVLLSMSDPITTIIQAANKVKNYYLIVDSFTLLTLPISYLIFKAGGYPQTTFYIAIVVFSIAHLIRLNIVKPLIHITVIDYTKAIIIPSVIIFGISITLSLLNSTMLSKVIQNYYFLNFLVIAIDLIISCVVSFYVMMNTAERKKILNLVKSKLHI